MIKVEAIAPSNYDSYTYFLPDQHIRSVTFPSLTVTDIKILVGEKLPLNSI